MSHELTIHEDGTVEFAYTGEVPWHVLGNAVPKDTPAKDWVKKSSLAWRIIASAMTYDGGLTYPGVQALFRDDNKYALGIVGKRYQIVQPHEIVEFYDNLVQAGGMTLEAAGSIYGGKKVWATAKMKDAGEVVKGDRMESYLLLVTANDGTMATQARFTNVRVVCRNTMNMAIGANGDKQGFAVRVPHSRKFDPEAVKKELELGHGAFKAFMEQARALAKKKLTDEQVTDILAKLLAKDHTPNQETVAKVDNSKAFEDIFMLYSGGARGSDFKGLMGTGWQLLNSVTEYVDHGRSVRTMDKNFESAVFGAGDAMKQDALQLLLAA